MTTSEGRLLHDVLREFGRGQNFRIARNNTGVAHECAYCDDLHKRHAPKQHPPYRVVKYGIPGAPDILGILAPSGRVIALETKSPTGPVTPKQKAYHAMLTKHGGGVVVVRSMDEAREWMREIGAEWR